MQESRVLYMKLTDYLTQIMAGKDGPQLHLVAFCASKRVQVSSYTKHVTLAFCMVSIFQTLFTQWSTEFIGHYHTFSVADEKVCLASKWCN